MGLEFGFFDNRISGEVDVYEKKTTDLLLNRPLPYVNGYSNIVENVGTLLNRGHEPERRHLPGRRHPAGWP